MAAGSDYRLGSIWLVNFEPSIGTEIRKTRPAIVISGTAFNQRRKVTVLPITSTPPSERILPVVVPIDPDASNGLTVESYIVCIDPMTFDKQRLLRQLGSLNPIQIDRVQSILRTYLELESIDPRVPDSAI
jgi:mRNA interferase MazF